jgi:hypothetical protein
MQAVKITNFSMNNNNSDDVNMKELMNETKAENILLKKKL